MHIEPLESRIAPATLVNPTTLTYTDIDGDKVTVTTSAGAFVFTNPPNGTGFTDTFVFTAPNAIGGQQLFFIDLRQGSGFQNANLSVSVVQAGAGDGLAAVGLIFAPGIDLGVVSVKGDLGEIDCGDSDTTTPGLKALNVRSMGRYGDATDPLSAGLQSNIAGALGSLGVTEDIKDAKIDVTANVSSDAKIGSITIGGSLIGGAADQGSIFAAGDIGPVRIGGDLIGGAGGNSARIGAQGNMGAVTIGGSFVGGAGGNSGSIFSNGEMGAVKIGGNVIGGTGASSGRISAASVVTTAKIASLTIGGSLLGGAGLTSGMISSGGDLGPVKIAHDMKGGAGDESGKIDVLGTLGAVTIGGSLLGGDGDYNTINTGGLAHRAQIFSIGGIGPVTIGHDLAGSTGIASGAILTGGGLASLTVGGSLLGGAGTDSARITSTAAFGPVRIGHDLQGGLGQNSGSFTAFSSLASVSIGGSLLGGPAISTGNINASGALGPVRIGHDLIGGGGNAAGFIGGSSVGAVTIGGSLVGGTNFSAGAIRSGGDLPSVRIGHDLIGGSLSSTAAADLIRTGYIESDGRIGSVFIGGSIIGGADDNNNFDLSQNASIRAGDDLGSLTVKGSLVGNADFDGNSIVVISARGQETPGASGDMAIGKISIGGRVEYARIFAGYGTALDALNADAQIGAVRVGADWAAGSIIAGAINLGSDDLPGASGSATADNVNFADAHDFKITGGTDDANRFSKISRLTIAGQAFGDPSDAAGDFKNFGFVAEEIGAVKIGGATIPLQAGRNNDGRFVGATLNLAVHEIGSLFGITLPIASSAKLVNASTVTYDDADGDHVTVKLSKPLLTAGNVNDVFKFDIGTVNDGVPAFQQLQLINLVPLATNGIDVTVKVVPGGGDRVANIGTIRAEDLNIGKVVIPGDLGGIRGGASTAGIPGLAALSVRSMGRLGLDTQPGGSGTFVPQLGGEINGGIGSLKVQQDIVGANIDVSGSIGPVTIGGSLIGSFEGSSGLISATQRIGAVKIGQHLQGGVGANSGLVFAGTSIASLTIGGSIIGGTGMQSAIVGADDDTLGAVKIAHNVIGGTANLSASLVANTGIAGITIGGSLLGGLGASSGRILTVNGDIGAVKIGHNVVGGSGNESGKIDSAGDLEKLFIRGSLLGGKGDHDTGVHTGQVFTVGDLGFVKINHDVRGGADGQGAGTIHASGNVVGVKVGGSVVGGAAAGTGVIASDNDIGPVKIAHDVLGGTGLTSGLVTALRLGPVSVGGSLVGAGVGTGQINGGGALGAVKIGHDVLGGQETVSGYIAVDGLIESVTIGGSLVGGGADFTGGIFPTRLGPVKIGRDLIGGSISGTTATLDRSGFIETGSFIESVRIGGSIIAGIDDSTTGALTRNASIRSGQDLGSLVVKGSLVGNTAPNGATPVVISARGENNPVGNTNVAIGKITIGGRVERANIFGGYSPNLGPIDGVQIGRVKVGHDWIASNLVAGVQNLGSDDTLGGTGANADNVNFGDTHDALIDLGDVTSRIARIVIGGAVVGTAAIGDHFGFSSVQIGFFKSLGFTAALDATKNPPIQLSPLTGDVTIREV